MDTGRLRNRLKALRAELAAAPPAERDQEDQQFRFLAALCRTAYGSVDERARVDYLRSLSLKECAQIYLAALTSIASAWCDSEEGQRFRSLSRTQQIAIATDVAKNGEIVMTYCLRAALFSQ